MACDGVCTCCTANKIGSTVCLQFTHRLARTNDSSPANCVQHDCSTHMNIGTLKHLRICRGSPFNHDRIDKQPLNLHSTRWNQQQVHREFTAGMLGVSNLAAGVRRLAALDSAGTCAQTLLGFGLNRNPWFQLFPTKTAIDVSGFAESCDFSRLLNDVLHANLLASKPSHIVTSPFERLEACRGP